MQKKTTPVSYKWQESKKTAMEEYRLLLIAIRIKSDTKKLLEIANFLKKQGAEGIILGCTELPVVFPKKYSLPIHNSTLLLSEALFLQNTGQLSCADTTWARRT